MYGHKAISQGPRPQLPDQSAANKSAYCGYAAGKAPGTRDTCKKQYRMYGWYTVPDVEMEEERVRDQRRQGKLEDLESKRERKEEKAREQRRTEATNARHARKGRVAESRAQRARNIDDACPGDPDFDDIERPKIVPEKIYGGIPDVPVGKRPDIADANQFDPEKSKELSLPTKPQMQKIVDAYNAENKNLPRISVPSWAKKKWDESPSEIRTETRDGNLYLHRVDNGKVHPWLFVGKSRGLSKLPGNIVGNGLYAATFFPRGQTIALYSGRVMGPSTGKLTVGEPSEFEKMFKDGHDPTADLLKGVFDIHPQYTYTLLRWKLLEFLGESDKIVDFNDGPKPTRVWVDGGRRGGVLGLGIGNTYNPWKEKTLGFPGLYAHMANDSRNGVGTRNCFVHYKSLVAVTNIFPGEELLWEYGDEYWDAARDLPPEELDLCLRAIHCVLKCMNAINFKVAHGHYPKCVDGSDPPNRRRTRGPEPIVLDEIDKEMLGRIGWDMSVYKYVKFQ
eukprot:jgi/Mesvir1/1494/Mv14477-RA.1